MTIEPRAEFKVSVRLDPIPGNMHTEESAMANILGALKNVMGHYEPTVEFIDTPTSKNEGKN